MNGAACPPDLGASSTVLVSVRSQKVVPYMTPSIHYSNETRTEPLP